MTTAGEAASLFGATDSTNDPFSLVTLDSELPNESTSTSAPSSSTAAAADLFGFSDNNANEFAVQQDYPAYAPVENGLGGSDTTWDSHTIQYNAYGDYGAPQYQQGYSQASAYGQNGSLNGWNHEQGQWSGYDQHATGTYLLPESVVLLMEI